MAATAIEQGGKQHFRSGCNERQTAHRQCRTTRQSEDGRGIEEGGMDRPRGG